ncbi:hypothetical protein BDW74DRAFT_184629 [Aspergillus multicolor]|uniref:uncharacterized protein n=1 Tax=Aspergillus multicolor TaxID=41759 RepID=UPI003CCD2B02
MESNNALRKACDLCYTRKLKCDGQQPRCSNCVIYARECTHAAAPRRKIKPKAKRPNATKTPDKLRPQLEGHQKGQDQATQVHQVKTSSSVKGITHATEAQHEVGSGSTKLPPLQEAMALVGIYLRTSNAVLPLFHPDTLLRMVGECYALHPRQRDPVVWAAINTVFALASQHSPKGAIEGPPANMFQHRPSGPHPTESYLNKAQSVMSTVMQGETGLLNIQTLLGMVMVLQTARDPTPALMLISATMRLVHKMGLHDRSASAHLDPIGRRQHARVFWVAYILDKDLALRAQVPSIQADDDIDVDLPDTLPVPLAPQDNDHTAGIVVTTDRKTEMNYFLARIQLANIEGQIYSYLYSTRALNASSQERVGIRQSISIALDEWRASIPLQFSAAVVTKTTKNKPANLGFFAVLHMGSLQCMMLLSRAQGMDEQWLMGVQNYTRGISALPIPPCWEVLVVEARDFVSLFQKVWEADCWFRWTTACPYASAAMVLIANNLHDISHPKVQIDMGLVDDALVWLDGIVEQMESPCMRKFRGICVEAVRSVKRKRALNSFNLSVDD